MHYIPQGKIKLHQKERIHSEKRKDNVQAAPFLGQLSGHLWTGEENLALRQLSLLNDCGLHTVVRDVKAALNSAQKESGESREQLLDRVNALAKRQGIKLSGNGGLSKDMLDKWLNPEDESRTPGIVGVELLCAALDTVEPLEVMAQPLGAMVIHGQDIILLKLARVREEQKILRKQMRKLEELLG